MAAPMETTSTSSRSATLPWVEKYRPKTITDVAFQDEVVSTLKKAIETNQFPHLLFYGPPGTGKTSTILAVARDLWGPDLYKDRVKELNASDERGIAVVRNSIKTFAQFAVSNPVDSAYPCPPFKLIILDEADSMTYDAQTALRRTMEAYTKTTRFCILCNYVSRIIEPLASRCAKFRFKPLPGPSIVGRLSEVAAAESVSLDEDALAKLVEVSGGDLRKAITYLQSTVRLHGPEVSAVNIMDITGLAPPNVIDGLYTAARSNSFDRLQVALNEIRCQGYAADELVNQLHDRVLVDTNLTDKQKSFLVRRFSMADSQLRENGDEELQLLALGAYMMRVFNNVAVDLV